MYIIVDKEKIEVKNATTFREKLYGLMFKPYITYGLLIKECNHIHTFFMKDNIDVLFLDQRNCVIYKYQNMAPNRTFKVYEDIKKTNVLELPKNTSQKIRIGDVLTFEGEHII